jgi:Condensin II non structural maintenance of chromosomes subunit
LNLIGSQNIVDKVKRSIMADEALISAARRALLAAVEGSDNSSALLDLYRRPSLAVTAAKQRSALLAAVRSWPKARRFFSALDSLLRNDDDTISRPDWWLLLRLAATLLREHLDGGGGADHEMFQCAHLLHNQLFSLQQEQDDENKPTIVAICQLCEAWWFAAGRHREQLILQALPLWAAVNNAADLQRLWRLRECLDLIDFDQPASDYLRHQLLHLASSPLALRCQPAGHQVVAYLLRLPDLDVHAAIRTQLVDAKPAVARAYALIYFRAWSAAPEQLEAAIVELCYATIHVARPALHQTLLLLLQPFYDAKTTPAVAQLLQRAYSPILWRALASGQALVRQQALHVLCRVFPLETNSQALQQGLAALTAALRDRQVAVRVAAAQATAAILVPYWDIVPAADIRQLLHRKYTHGSFAAAWLLLSIAASHCPRYHCRAGLRRFLGGGALCGSGLYNLLAPIACHACSAAWALALLGKLDS